MLSNIDINPPGITLPPAPKPAPGLPGSAGPPASAQPVLHIGSLVSTVHTERAASASRATSSHNLQIGGVAVLGQPATIDDSGVHLIGQNQSLQPVVDQLNKLFTAVNGLPTVAGQHIVPQGSMAGPIVTDTVSHNGNQASSSLSGLTLSLTNTILVPSQTQGLTQTCGKPPPPPTLVPASVTYTVTLATAQSSAYGYSFPPLPPLDLSGASAASSGSTLGSSLPPLSSDLGAITTSPGSNGSGGGAAHGARRHTLTARPASSVVDMAMLSKPALLTLATLAELLILGALIACYRLPPARAPRESAIADMDLA